MLISRVLGLRRWVAGVRGREASLVADVSIRISVVGEVRAAACRAERPTAPAPKMAIVEEIGGLRTLLSQVRRWLSLKSGRP